MLNVEIVLPEKETLKKENTMSIGGNIVPLKIEGQEENKPIAIAKQKHTLLTENGIATLDDEPTNSQPGGAYLINFDTLYSDNITGQGKRRWYFFQLTDKKKITLYMSPTANTSVDNDLVLYTLDTSTGVLTEVARSQNGPATYELLSYVGKAGIYLFCVAAYAGTTTNEFSFLARLSDKWDEREGDDSIYQAQEQPINTVVKHTIDNSIDQDVSILKITTAGIYSLTLMNVPENCNYPLQLLDSNANIIGTLGKNATATLKMSVGGYILRLLSVDGTFDADAEVSVMVGTIPDNATGYQVWTTEDGTHCVEVMCIVTRESISGYRYEIRVDGVILNYQNIEVKTVKSTASSQSECSMSTTKESSAVGVAIGSYSGTKGCKNALWLNIDQATYAESHSRTSTKYSDMANASHIAAGTNQYGQPCYTGSWTFAATMPNMYMIVDLDRMEAAEFRHPNWFYGEDNYTHYGAYGSPYYGDFTFVQKVGEIEG